MFYIKIIILYYVVQPCLNSLFFLPENEAALVASREYELDKEYGFHFGLTCYYIINSKGNAIFMPRQQMKNKTKPFFFFFF